MSKNNIKEYYRKTENGKQRFGLRKLSVGVASVLLGTTFIVGGVSADELSDSQNSSTNSSAVTQQQAQPANEQPQPVNEQPSEISSQGESVNTTASLLTSNGLVANVNDREVMAENDNVIINVQYKNTGLPAGQSFKVSYTDPSKWQVSGWPANETRNLGSAFTATNNGDGSFTITSNSTSGNVANAGFELSFGLQYRNQVSENAPETLTITTTRNSNVLETQEFTPIIIPYRDKVTKDEIAHGWAGGLKSVNNNDDNLKTILDGTAATQPEANRQAMQYMIEWNYGKAGNTDGSTLSPLDSANFTAQLSEGQTIIPDTIKAFRVYQPDAVNSDGSRVDINNVYNNITHYDNGQFTYEDTAFEQFLKDHLIVTTNNGTTNLSWTEYQEALAEAKTNHTEPPLVNGIHLDESDMSHVKVSSDTGNETHDFSKNSGDNTDKSVVTPHSTFFIQMDALLDENMPMNWTKPGDGPAITYNPVSGDFNGEGVTKSRSVSPVFQGGGNGFSHEEPPADSGNPNSTPNSTPNSNPTPSSTPNSTPNSNPTPSSTPNSTPNSNPTPSSTPNSTPNSNPTPSSTPNSIPEAPTESEQPLQPAKPDRVEFPVNRAQPVPVQKAQPKISVNENHRLPQTGAQVNRGIVALGLTALVASLGLALKKKKNI